MNAYIYLNIYSLIMLMVIITVFFHKKRADQSEVKIYSRILITLAITNIVGIISSFLK